MDDTAHGQHFVECPRCGQHVRYFCFQCNEDLCQTCKEYHQTHDVRLYREKYHTFHSEKCSAHPQDNYSAFCRNCEVPLCVSCVHSPGHSGHLLVNIEAAYDEYRQSYRQWCSILRSEQLRLCRTRQDRVDRELEERRALFKDILDHIENQSAKLKLLITECVDKKKKELEDRQNTQMNDLERTKSELQSFSAQLNTILDGFENSASYPAQFLSYVKAQPMLDLRCPDTSDYSVPVYEPSDLKEEEISKLVGYIKTEAPNPTSKTSSVATVHQKIDFPELTSIRHISHLESKVWVSDSKNLVCKDLDTMELTHKLSVCEDCYGCHTVNDKGELIYLDTNHNILKWSEKMKVDHRPVVNVTKPWVPMSVHFSRQTSTLLVGMVVPLEKAKVVRYNVSGQVVQSLEDDGKGHALYEAPAYITENQTGDVIVSDYKKKAVVVVDRGGDHRFSYRGPEMGFFEQLWPRGIATDNQGNILVSNLNTRNCVHVVDKDGHFLKILEVDADLLKPCGLSYDPFNKLIMAGSCNSQILHVQRYVA